jgi:hypothetical protein
MTPTRDKPAPCKYCGKGGMKHLGLMRHHCAVGMAYTIYCRNCGTQGGRRRKPEAAVADWNQLHEGDS